ncbi:hypothetical protein GGP70_000078 [Salinibacter ruber]|nr:hypothetical protein [Salinibacter ruber]
MVFVGDRFVAQSRAPWAFLQWPRSAEPAVQLCRAQHSVSSGQTVSRVHVAETAGYVVCWGHPSHVRASSPVCPGVCPGMGHQDKEREGDAIGANGNPGLIPLKPADADALSRASTAIEETLPAEQGPRVSTRRVIPTAHRAGGPVGLRPRTRRSTSRSEPTLRRETAQRKGSRGAPVWEAPLSHGFFRMYRPVQPCVLSVWVQMGFAQVLASPRCIPPCFWRSAWRF